MKKIYLIPMLAMFGLALVFAGVYIVNSLNLTVGVAEPFTVQYAVLGDSGTYVSQTCENAVWFTSDSTELPTGNMYAGESRYVCIKIANAGEADIPYVVTSEVMNTNETLNAACVSAFGELTLSGTAIALFDTTTGVEVIADSGEPTVEGCKIQIDVARGTQ